MSKRPGPMRSCSRPSSKIELQDVVDNGNLVQ
jgi:hypothetical protein